MDAERLDRIEADGALQTKIAEGDTALNDRVPSESDEKFNCFLNVWPRLEALALMARTLDTATIETIVDEARDIIAASRAKFAPFTVISGGQENELVGEEQ